MAQRFLLIIAYIFLVLPMAGWQADSHAADNLNTPVREKTGYGVIESISLDRGAAIMVALEEPAMISKSPASRERFRQEISQLQEEVLSGLDPGDFELRLRFQSVPALAGRVFTAAGLARLTANPRVVRIDLDVGGTGALASSLLVIGADLRHANNNLGEGVVVAVLDSGVDTDHADLADDLVHEECFLNNVGAIDGVGLCPNGSDRQSGAGAAEDDAGHGTHVTGIVTSRGTRSSAGVAPAADFVAIKVTAGPSFSGTFSFFSEIVAALDFIINNPGLGVQVINMSLVTNARFAGDCDNSTAYNIAGASAINTLRASGVTAFASSGNNGSGTLMASPACLSNVISVGATNNTDAVASITDSNASTDMMAPGISIVSTGLGNGTRTASGTSMASPHAAGCAALLIEAGEATNPDDIEARLELSPVHVVDATNGLSFPRVDCSPPPGPLFIDGFEEPAL